MMACTAGTAPLVPVSCFDWNPDCDGPRQERARMELDVIGKSSAIGTNCGCDMHTTRGVDASYYFSGPEWV
jgi:hypothetical protein